MDETLYQTLLNDGFRFVSFRPRSEKETRDFLERKLKRKKVYFDPKVFEKVIARLHELNYLDDVKFARWWIEQRAIYRPKGIRLIRQELMHKGVSKNLVEQILNTNSDYSYTGRDINQQSLNQVELAKNAIAKKIKLWIGLPLLERKKKIYGFLGRRGFTGETIDRVIDEISGFGVK